MPKLSPISDVAPTSAEVRDYLRDMAGQLAEMAQAAGLTEAARLLREARDLCEIETPS